MQMVVYCVEIFHVKRRRRRRGSSSFVSYIVALIVFGEVLTQVVGFVEETFRLCFADETDAALPSILGSLMIVGHDSVAVKIAAVRGVGRARR